MANYQDFFEDFPRRCHDLLESQYASAAAADREVTLTLMVASAGFVVPFERLRKDGLFEPPTTDRQTSPTVTTKFDKLLGTLWAQSSLSAKVTSISMGSLSDPKKAVDDWSEIRTCTPPSASATVSNVITVIRHALAHGSIYTKPNDSKQVEAVIFVSGGLNRKTGTLTPYKFVQFDPTSLRQFLIAWFDELSSWRASPTDLIQALEKAA